MTKKIFLIIMLSTALAALAEYSGKLTGGTIAQLMAWKQNNGPITLEARHRAPAMRKGRMAAFIKFDSQATLDSLHALGVTTGTVAGNVATASIPLEAMAKVTALQGVIAVEAAQPVTMLMDSARRATHVDLLQQGPMQSLQGEEITPLGTGVVISDIDAGLDFTHPALWKMDRSESRLRRVWLPPTCWASLPAPIPLAAIPTTE